MVALVGILLAALMAIALWRHVAGSLVEWDRGAQLLETLGVAVRRELPVGTVLAVAAQAHGPDDGQAQRRWQPLRNALAGPQSHYGTMLRRAVARLSSGESLAGALQHVGPRYVPRTVVATVAATEGRAELAGVLFSAARRHRRDTSLRAELFAWLMIPVIVLGIAMFLRVFIVPNLLEVLHAMRGEAAGGWVNMAVLQQWMFWGLAIVLGVVAVVVAATWSRRCAIRRVAERVWLRTPVLGHMLRLDVTARAVAVMASLVRAHVPLARAFRVAAPVSGLVVASEGMVAAAEAVEKGVAPAQVASSLPWTEFARARFAARLQRGTPEQLARCLEEVEQVCTESMERQRTRLTQTAYYGTTVFVAVFVCLQWAFFMQTYMSIVKETQPW